MHVTEILVGIAFLTATANVDATADMGLKEKFWKPMCDLSEELDMHPQDATRVLTDALKAVKSMQTAALQAEIFSEINYGQKTGISAEIMADYFASKAQTGVRSLEDGAIQKELAAAATTAYLKGRIDEWLQFMNGMRTEGTRGCLLDGTGTSPATNTPGQIGGRACKRRLSPVKVGTATRAQLTDIGYPNLQKQQASNGNWQDDDKNCRLTSGHHTNGAAHTGTISAPFSVAAGYIQLQTTAIAPTIKDLSSLTAKSDQDEQAYIDAWAAVKGKLYVGDKAFRNDTGDIHTFSHIRDLVCKGFLNKHDATAEDIKTEIIKWFGGEKEQNWKEMVGLILKQEIPPKVAGSEEKDQLGNIADPEKLTAILTHYRKQNMISYTEIKEQLTRLKTTAEKAAASTVTAEKVCNYLKEKSDCDTNKKCTYDKTKEEGKKCTLSEEATQTVEKAKASEEEEDAKTASDRCTKHTKKEECEAENKNVKAGEKAVCCWIEDKCKDFSTLLNKKCTLIHSAAFVNLVPS